MIVVLCCVYDAVALLAGAVVLRRAPWRGARAELAVLAAVGVVALGGITFAGRLLGGFAMLRALCHGLFCVVLPLFAWRAIVVWRHSRGLAAALVLTALLGEAAYVFARRVEPYRLEVTSAALASPKLAALPRPLVVAVVADLQTDAMGDYEVGVFDRIAARRPDLVLFLGDYLQVGGDAFRRERELLRAQVARLSPPLGSFAVGGDVDQGGADAVFADTAVQVIDDRHVELPDLPLRIEGLGRMRSRAPFLDGAVVRRLRDERYTIVVGHAPDYMLSVVRDGLAVDALLLAGHTHGGQVQLPWFGPLTTLSAVPRWLGGGGVFRRGDAWLCCSRGIGMERDDAPRIRFWCRPQLVFLELGPHG